MHEYKISESIKQRVLNRQGKLVSHDSIPARKTALIVVDMQQYFVGKGFPAEIPAAREIVSNINSIAAALRSAGGHVAWLQTTAAGALDRWANYHNFMLRPERLNARINGLKESSEGYQLYPALKTDPDDLFVRKITYSPFSPGSSDLDAKLRQRGVTSVIITGTVTNVCCESTARDAMLLDYRVIMVADGNAAANDHEHAATLDTFLMFFGDVLWTNDIVARLA